MPWLRAVMRASALVVLASSVARPASALPDAAADAPNPSTCDVRYYGGPVLQNVHVVAVYWTANVDPAVVAQIPDFYRDVVSSDYVAQLSEYDTVGVTTVDGQPGTNQGIGRGTFGGAFTISPSKCSDPQATSCPLADADIQAELAAQIAAGHLPAPRKGCDGQTSTLYMIELPSNVVVTMDALELCFAGIVCAYHSSTLVSGQLLPYAVFPNVEVDGAMTCLSSCTYGKGSDTFARVTTIHSHELAEAITDPGITPGADGGDFARPTGWIGDCNEIADRCFEEALAFPCHTWTVTTLWSNEQGGCVLESPVAPVCTSPGVPAGCRAGTCADEQDAGGMCVPVDAGSDGADSGALRDAGVADATFATDAGETADAGDAAGASMRAGDAATGVDAASASDASTERGDGGGGCGCRASPATPSAAATLGALALALAARRRRRRV